MKHSNDSIRTVFETIYGLIEVDHFIELITYVALVSKEAPQEFKNVLNAGNVNQLEVLESIGGGLSNKLPHSICQPPSKNWIDSKVLNSIAAYVENLTDYKLLTQQIREFSKLNKRYGELISSNYNLELIFKALIGECTNKTVYDGSTGLARIATSLDAKYLYLQELNTKTWITSYRLLILEDKEFTFENSNSLISPKYEDLKTDIVVMEPPLGLRFSAEERRELSSASFLSIKPSAILPASANDSLWVQLALSKLKDDGKAYLLVPQGFLFRGGYDAKVRAFLIENEFIESVIALPSSILEYSSIAPVLLVLNKNKESGSPINFVDATDIGVEHRNKIRLKKEDAEKISSLSKGELPDNNKFKAVYIPEIRANNNDLNVNRYIQKLIKLEKLDIQTELKKLSDIRKDYESSDKKLTELLSNLS